jgi:hypothetical protein
MLGRQRIALDIKTFRALLFSLGYFPSEKKLLDIFSNNKYAENFFHLLGAEIVESLDASSFEGATIIHDLNTPIPENLKNRFTTIIDGGLLEHVFNFPVAIKNCMEMLQVGGTFIISTITNNMMGHGFYQFSPELFYRVFSQENGFELNRMILYENPDHKWYQVMDPAIVGCRVGVQNCKQIDLLIIAKKKAAIPIFLSYPQQSDYTQLWKGQTANSSAHIRERKPFLQILSTFLKNALIPRKIWSIYRKLNPKFAPPFFIRVPD